MNDSAAAQKFLLKDHLFNRQKVSQIAGEIQSVYPLFAQDKFVRTVVEGFPISNSRRGLRGSPRA